jgi:hypothetical protein
VNSLRRAPTGRARQRNHKGEGGETSMPKWRWPAFAMLVPKDKALNPWLFAAWSGPRVRTRPRHARSYPISYLALSSPRIWPYRSIAPRKQSESVACHAPPNVSPRGVFPRKRPQLPYVCHTFAIRLPYAFHTPAIRPKSQERHGLGPFPAFSGKRPPHRVASFRQPFRNRNGLTAQT